jgi:tetratricopeptide (TPR) repeat protein
VEQQPNVHQHLDLLDQTYWEPAMLLRAQGRQGDREKLHRAAVAFLERQVAANPQNPRLRFALASMYTDLGNFLADSGQPVEAENALRLAIALLEPLVALEPEAADYRCALEGAYSNLGLLLSWTGTPLSAEHAYRQAITLCKQLSAAFPDVPTYQRYWAHTWHLLGGLLARQGRFQQAEDALRQSGRLREKLLSQHPGEENWNHLWELRRELISFLLARGRAREAEAALRQNQESFEELVAHDPDAMAYWRCLTDVRLLQAHALTLARQPEQAEAALLSCVRILREHPGFVFDRDSYSTELERSCLLLLDLLHQAGRTAEVEAIRRQQIELQSELAKLFPENPEPSEYLARRWRDLGDWLTSTGRPEGAIESYRSALACYCRLIQRFPARGEYERQRAEVAKRLGERLRDLGRHREAVEVFRQTLGAYQQLVRRFPRQNSHRLELALVYLDLGRALWASGDRTAAERAFRQYGDIYQRQVAEFPADLPSCVERAHSSRWLAILLQESRPDEAEPVYQQALPLLDELAHRYPTEGTLRCLLADTHRRLGQLYTSTGRARRAEIACRTAFALYQDVQPDMVTAQWVVDDMCHAYQALIDHLKTAGREAEAQGIERRAIGHHEKLLDAAIALQPKNWQIRQARARFRARRGQFAAAAADIDQALAIQPDEDGARFEYAGFLLLAGDSAGYRHWCAREQERLSVSPDETDQRFPTFVAARTFALAADSGVETSRTIRMGEEAVARNPDSAWMLHALALAHYRGGELKLALNRAHESLRGSPWSAPYLNWLLLALVHHDLGQANEAQYWLAKGTQAMPGDIFRDPPHPYDWVESQLLLRETRTRMARH